MTTPAVLYSVNELPTGTSTSTSTRTIDVDTSIENKHGSKHAQTAGYSYSYSLGEEESLSAMVTVMEDSSMDFILVAPDTPQDNSWQFLQPSIRGKEEEESFVLVSDKGIYHASSWWQSLRKCAFLAARKGSEWSIALLAKMPPTLTNFHPRRSSIHVCYDWVSDTNILGGRLILPGQLISLDDHPDLGPEMSSSSTIMVSAHDLLACQSSGQERATYPSFTTSSLPGVVLELVMQRSRVLAKATSNALAFSTRAVSRRTGSLLSKWEHNTGLVANTAGWIYQTLEWYYPASPPQDEKSTKDCLRDDGKTIELPTIADKIQTARCERPSLDQHM